MSRRHNLGDLQLAILRVLWNVGEASASVVHRSLREERSLAVTTIKTMLRKLEERGIVGHRQQGRTFIYRALIAESEVRERMVGELLGRMFAGDGAALVNHLIEVGEIEADELEQLRAEIARRRAGS